MVFEMPSFKLSKNGSADVVSIAPGQGPRVALGIPSGWCDDDSTAREKSPEWSESEDEDDREGSAAIDGQLQTCAKQTTRLQLRATPANIVSSTARVTMQRCFKHADGSNMRGEGGALLLVEVSAPSRPRNLACARARVRREAERGAVAVFVS